jgi:exodeoxyribonuclease V gamma subunit
MLRILYASSTEVLLDDLVRALAEPGDPKELRSVLLPSRPLVERVRVRLVRSHGLAMGCELLLPAAFLERIASALGLEPLHPSWSAEGMFWRVLERLPELALRHPRLERASGDLRARVALAREVADRFDQYLHFRPDLIRAWDEGLPFNEFLGRHPELKAVFRQGFPDSVREDEAWQRELWAHLCQGVEGRPHPARRLELMAEKASRQGHSVFGGAVEVLATGPLPFPILKMLKALGDVSEVRLRFLLPANGYLADIRPRWLQLTRGEAVDLDAEANPLVAQMGRQAIEAFQGLLLLSPDGQEFEPLEEDERPGDSLLKRLQADVRALRQPDPGERPVGEGPEPGPMALRSLRVHRCHGPRREVEALRDELLRAFKEMPDLKPEDVLILAPDLEVYGPLAEAVLMNGAEPRLPLALAERAVEQKDPALKAVLGLAGLASGRAAMSEVRAFLELPAVRAALFEASADALVGALSEAGLTFGLDRDHRIALGAGTDDIGTWRRSLDRLWAGRWFGGNVPAVEADGQPALPKSGDLSSDAAARCSALEWFERLLATVVLWREPAPPLEWAVRVENAWQSLLDPERTALDLSGCVDLAVFLRSAGSDHGCATAMDAATVADCARSFGEDEERRVDIVGGRIALGGLKPLRALPCRVLAILGLSDAAFPRRAQARAWDLLAALPQPGDRDPRKDDRQLFLDCLLAAKDRVILSAPVLDPSGGEPGPLSTCVEELLWAACETAGGPGERPAWSAALKVDHPLQPFSSRNFGAGSAERSFDAAGLEWAAVLAQPRRERAFAVDDPSAAVPRTLRRDGMELVGFLKQPARAWLKRRGLEPPYDPEDPLAEDDEPVDVGDALQRSILDRRSLEEALFPEDPHLYPRLAAERLLPLGQLGRLRAQAQKARAQRLADALRGALGGSPEFRRRSLDLGEGRVLDATLAYGPGEGGWAHWVARSVAVAKGAPKAEARTLLEAWLLACAAAVDGCVRPGICAQWDKNGYPLLWTLKPLDPGSARKSLARFCDLADVGAVRLLPFSPKTSLVLALAEREGDSEDQCAEAAQEAWFGGEFAGPQFPECEVPAHALAWRGIDPFAGEGITAWLELAREIYGPALEWWEASAEAQAAAPEPKPAKAAARTQPKAPRRKGAA